MTTTNTPGAAGDPAVPMSPLLPDDPPKVGAFWLDSRVLATPAGSVFGAHDDTGTPVLLVQLSDGASNDAVARDRFAGEVNRLHIDTVIARGGHGQDEGRLAGKFRDEADDPVEPGDAPLAPWVALYNDGSPTAVAETGRILAGVALAGLPQQGAPGGPDYRLHWIDRTGPGVSRVWPLPWPGRYDKSSWITIALSWLLMVLLAALAILIAILLFQNFPKATPPPPVPTSMTGTPPPQSSSPSPQSGSPSPQSGSPSPQSGSPSPSGSGSPTPSKSGSPSASGSPSPSGSGSPTGTPSAEGSPSPISRL